MSFKKWLALSAALLIPVAVYADGGYQATNPLQPYLNVDAPNQLDGVSINPNTAAAVNATTVTTSNLVTTGTIPTQGVVFSSALSGNPLVLESKLNAPVGAPNTAPGQIILAAVAGRTIYPSNVTLEALGGNTGTCTGLKVVCSASQIVLGTFPTGELTSGVPSSVFSASDTVGAPMGAGCAPGDGLLLSAYGGLCATATSFNSVVTYTVQ